MIYPPDPAANPLFPHVNALTGGDKKLAAAMIVRAMSDLGDHNPALTDALANRHAKARARGAVFDAAACAALHPTASETAFDWLNGAETPYPFQLACDLLSTTPEAMRKRIAATLGCDYRDGILLGNVNQEFLQAFRALPT